MRTLLFCLFFMSVSIAHAVAQETKLAFDSKGTIEMIDNAYNKTYHFFTEYEHFIQANLYQLADSSISLEVEYLKDGKQVRIRKVLSQNDLLELRQHIDSQLALALNKPLDQSGRLSLICGSTGLGLMCYGLMLPSALDVNDQKSTTALYLLTASTGFFLPYFATKDKEVTNGMATLTNFGLGFGLLHGLLFAGALDYSSNNQALLLTSIGFGLTEGIGFYHLAKNAKLTNAQSGLMAYYSNYGALFSLASVYVLDKNNEHLAFGSALLGATAGMGLGYLLSKKQKYSVGDVFFTGAATSVAAFNAVAIMNAIKPDNARSNVSAAILGSVTGAIWSHYYTRDRNYKVSNAIYTTLGSSGGAFLGRGLGIIVGLSEVQDPNAILLTAAGATAGFFITNYFLKDDNETNVTTSKFKFNLNPAALFTAQRAYNPNIPGGGIVPAFTASYQF